jgi:hypothetical protein
MNYYILLTLAVSVGLSILTTISIIEMGIHKFHNYIYKDKVIGYFIQLATILSWCLFYILNNN